MLNLLLARFILTHAALAFTGCAQFLTRLRCKLLVILHRAQGLTGVVLEACILGLGSGAF